MRSRWASEEMTHNLAHIFYQAEETQCSLTSVVKELWLPMQAAAAAAAAAPGPDHILRPKTVIVPKRLTISIYKIGKM